MQLGAHIRTSNGLAAAAQTGRAIGCDVIQIFSKSPHSWRAPPIAPEAAESFRAAVKAERIRTTAIHHCYLTNLAAVKPPIFHGSRAALLDELERASLLGAQQIIFHPGAHGGAGVAAGLAKVTESLNAVLAESPKGEARVLLENSAGQGTTLCSRFEELAQVLDGITDKKRVGVAIDTCHLFASGQDFRTPETYGAVMDRLRSSLGVRTVQAFHLNDSRAELGKHLDRHENIGRGMIGVGGFAQWLNDRTWAKTPAYLETPLSDDDYTSYVEDLRTLRGLVAPGRQPAPARRER